MKICLVDKNPTNSNYEKVYGLHGHEVTVKHLSSKKVKRLLKRDVDLEPFDPNDFDYIILVGSEAVKTYTTKTAVGSLSGKRVDGKDGYGSYLASISPAMLMFKPESRPEFEQTVSSLHRILSGKEKVIAKGDYTPIRTTEAAVAYLKSLLLMEKLKIFALDTETSGLEARKCYCLGWSITHEAGQGVYIDADIVDDECITLLQRLLNKVDVVMHNAKFDMHILTYHFGLTFREGHTHDTMIMHYILDERAGTHGLKHLAIKHTDMGAYDDALDEFKKAYLKEHGMKAKDFSYDLIPFDIMWPYAAKDTDATLRIYLLMAPIVFEKFNALYFGHMLPGLHFLWRMENRGIPVSRTRLTRAREILNDKIDAAWEKLNAMEAVTRFQQKQGKEFNPNSVVQLRSLLFDHIGLSPTGIKTDTGADSTNMDSLIQLAEQHPIPELILQVRKNTKLKNTYVDKLLGCIDRDNKVRTGFNLTTTTSGRLSSSGNFNVQQLPRDDAMIKGCVEAPEGYKIVALDLTTAEVYIAAVLSGDKALQQVFINMQTDPAKYPDFHSNIAHMVFKPDCLPVDVKRLFPILRQASKEITFGILFGSGAKSVAESINKTKIDLGMVPDTTKADAEGYMATYFQKFPRLKAWIKESHSEIRQQGYIYSWFGRKRRLHNIGSTDNGIVSGEVRSGFNAIIQGPSSDLLLRGCVGADKEIMSKGIDAEIIALVHDSIVGVVKTEDVGEYISILIKNIREDFGLSIPGFPIELEADSEDGGSRDYSCGKLEKQYPTICDYTHDHEVNVVDGKIVYGKGGILVPCNTSHDEIRKLVS